MATIGNHVLPGSIELGREIQEAAANMKNVDIKTTVATHSVAAKDVHYSNGTVTVTIHGRRIVIPFHAIAQVEIH